MPPRRGIAPTRAIPRRGTKDRHGFGACRPRLASGCQPLPTNTIRTPMLGLVPPTAQAALPHPPRVTSVNTLSPVARMDVAKARYVTLKYPRTFYTDLNGLRLLGGFGECQVMASTGPVGCPAARVRQRPRRRRGQPPGFYACDATDSLEAPCRVTLHPTG
jgi:hypothetical protein